MIVHFSGLVLRASVWIATQVPYKCIQMHNIYGKMHSIVPRHEQLAIMHNEITHAVGLVYLLVLLIFLL